MTRKIGKLQLFLLGASALLFAASLTAATAINAYANSALDSDDNGYDYMRLHNLTGPSGVALGAAGACATRTIPTRAVLTASRATGAKWTSRRRMQRALR